MCCKTKIFTTHWEREKNWRQIIRLGATRPNHANHAFRETAPKHRETGSTHHAIGERSNSWQRRTRMTQAHDNTLGAISAILPAFEQVGALLQGRVIRERGGSRSRIRCHIRVPRCQFGFLAASSGSSLPGVCAIVVITWCQGGMTWYRSTRRSRCSEHAGKNHNEASKEGSGAELDES